MLRSFKIRHFVMMTLMLLAGLVVPAFAQGEEGGGTVSINYFSKLFHTDSFLGNIVIWSLVVQSTALMAIIIKTAMASRESLYSPPELFDQLQSLIAQKKYKDAMEVASGDQSPLGQIMAWSLAQAGRGYDAMEEGMYEMADNIGNDRVRGLVWMEIAGAAGPMLGLFGTVYGMIVAFTQMVAVGGQPKPAELAGGIATALVCTFWGLVVGIPGVISAAGFRVKVERLSARAMQKALLLLNPFKPGSRPPSVSGSKPASRPSPAPAPSASPEIVA